MTLWELESTQAYWFTSVSPLSQSLVEVELLGDGVLSTVLLQQLRVGLGLPRLEVGRADRALLRVERAAHGHHHRQEAANTRNLNGKMILLAFPCLLSVSHILSSVTISHCIRESELNSTFGD